MDTQDWIVLSLLFYAAMAFGVVWYSFKVRRASVFEPIGQYLVFVSLFTLPLPIRASITMEPVGNVSPYLAQFAPYLAVSVVLTAISLPTFAAGYYSRAARRLGDRVPLLANRNTRGMRAAVFALVALSTVLIYFLTLDIGGLGAFLLLGYKSSEATFGRGYLAVGFPWLVVAMVALLELYRMTRSWFDLGCFFALLLVNLGMHVVTGNRSMLMYLGIVLAIYVHFAIRRLSWALLLPIAIAGFIGLNLMGMLRGSNYDSLDEFTEQTTTSVDHLSGDGQEGLFYTLTIGEFVVPFETLPQMVRSVGVTQWPWLGLSILRAPVYLIPSFVFPDRPVAVANWYMEEFYGGGYGLNEGRAFFFLAEGYLNFGPFGVFLVALLWGIGWGGLHRWMARGCNRFASVLVYALLIGFMFRCIAGDVATLLVGTTQQSLAGVAIVLVLSRVFGLRVTGRRSGAKTA